MGGEWLDRVVPGPSNKVAVHLSPDWGIEFPVEVVVDGGPGYVDAATLGVSDRLAGDLTAWQAWWDDHTSLGQGVDGDGTDPGWARWQQEGAELVKRLQAELGDRCEVIWNG